MHHILKDPVMACLDAVTMRLTSVALESPRFVFSLRKPVGLGIPRDPTSPLSLSLSLSPYLVVVGEQRDGVWL